MKTLVVVVHPHLSESKINAAWMKRLEQEDVTVHNLYEKYPDFKIDVETEQRLLLEHDRIVFQFPFYWYSSPALLKQWEDDVLAFNFAYGPDGNKLKGKELMLAISTGGPEEAYSENGYNRMHVSDYINPFRGIANLAGMEFLPPFILNGIRTISADELKVNAEEYAAYVLK